MQPFIAEIQIIGDLFPETIREILDMFTAAVSDADCVGILFSADSPGGEFCPEMLALADAVFYAPKPVYGYVTGDALSGLYWVLSQCKGGISAHRGAFIGSIGVVVIAEDVSQQASECGVKVVVVRSVANKAPAQYGEPITPEAIAIIAKGVNDVDRLFRADILRARPQIDMSKQLGDCFIASDAMALGLIDRIESRAELLARLNTGKT